MSRVNYKDKLQKAVNDLCLKPVYIQFTVQKIQKPSGYYYSMYVKINSKYNFIRGFRSEKSCYLFLKEICGKGVLMEF